MVLSSDLQEALKSLMVCADRRSSIASEKSVLLQGDGKKLTMLCSSIKGSLTLEVPAFCSLDPVGVSCAAFEKAVKVAPDDEITIELENKRVVLKSGRRTVRLKTLPAEEFTVPHIKDEEFKNYAQVEGGELSGALLRAVRVASPDKGPLKTVSLCGDGNEIIISATDRSRLFTCAIPSVSVDSRPLLLDRDSCKALAGTIKRAEEVNIVTGPGVVRFIYDSSNWTLPIIDGKFPDVTRLLPQEGERLLIDPEQLKGALEGVRAVCGDLDSRLPVRLSLTTKGSKLKYRDSELGDMEEDLPDIKLVAGKEREFGFNGAYLSDMILALANPEGLIGEPDQSVLFHDHGAKYLLMPVSLPG